MSLAARYVDAKKEQQARIGMTPIFGGLVDPTATVNLQLDEAKGWGGVIGLDFFPKEWLTIGLTYQSRIALEYDVTYDSGTNANGFALLNQSGFTDGGTVRSDLPALFGAGVNIQATQKLRYEASFRYYFNRDADLGKTQGGEALSDKISDSIEFGIAFEYAFMPKLKGSLGYLYSGVGGNVDFMTPELPELDANTFAGGIAWEVIRDLDLQFAGGMATYRGQTTSSGAISYDRNVPFLSFGVQYTF